MEKLSLPQLREYLENARLLEADVHALKQTISDLEARKKTPKPAATFYPPNENGIPQKPLPPGSDTWDLTSSITSAVEDLGEFYVIAVCLGLAIAFIAGIISAIRGNGFWNKFLITAAIAAGICLLVTISAVIKCDVEMVNYNNKKNEEKQRRYNQDLAAYEKALESFEKRRTEYQENVRQEKERFEAESLSCSRYNQGIDVQISFITAQLQQTQSALDALYSVGVIYHKYRSLIPVTMFCEYIDSGRRHNLEGIDGMYDLYETEVLGQLILSEISKINQNLKTISGQIGFISYQLGGISNKLTGIQRNQVMVYEEVSQGNAIAEKICAQTCDLLEKTSKTESSLKQISDEISKISNASDVASFNSGVIARRTDAIARIAEYEYAIKHPMFPSP